MFTVSRFCFSGVASGCRLLIIGLLLAAPAAAQISFAPLPNQPPDNIYSLVTDPTTSTLYACNGARVIYSTDEGVSWQATANSGTTNLKCVYVSATGQLYAGAEKAVAAGVTAGVFKYNKVLNSWAPLLNSPLNVTALLEDPVSGTLYAGTGLSGAIAPNPISYGTGVYAFTGATWSAINTGLNALPGYAVKPAIKAFGRLSTGELVAATYGGGVLRYVAGTWATYGTGLGNLSANCLTLDAAGLLYAGTDGGAYVRTPGGAWAVAAPGLPAGKPVRALLTQGVMLYAGLGYYHYQKGSISGELYKLTLPSAGPWTDAGAGFNSTSVLGLTSTASNLFAAACGVWMRPAAGGSWTFSLTGFSLPNRVFQLTHNSQGHLFAMCGSLGASAGTTTFTYGGVFRSTDYGASWVAINQGIKCQGLTAIFVDSHDNLWLGGRQFVGQSANPAWGNPELYKSVDNGATWVRNLSIATCHDGYQFFAEAPNGRLYVTHSFFATNTNISATNDYNTFDNTLTGGQNIVNAKTYGLGINSAGDVFLGTETNGIVRSTVNGAAGTFLPITVNASTAPTGNNTVYVDPYNGNLFGAGTHGKVNGVGNWPKDNFCSLAANNGLNMFPFNNLPDFASMGAMTSDNRGNFYCYLNTSSFTTAGVYVAAPPFSSGTVFTRLIIAPLSTISYQFSSFMADACGYLYGMNTAGAGIYRSTQPVNVPTAAQLLTPAAASSSEPTAATLTWATDCAATSYRVQVAKDAAFGMVIYDNPATLTNAFPLPAGTLAAGTTYYWRVQSSNAAGSGPWSAARAFATVQAPLPVTLLSFTATPDRPAHAVRLRWQTTNEIRNAYFTIEKSADGYAFSVIDTVAAATRAAATHQYEAADAAPNLGVAYYRLGQMDQHGHAKTYSAVVGVRTPPTAGCLTVGTDPASGTLSVLLPCEHPTYQVTVLTVLGETVVSFPIGAAIAHASFPLSGLREGLFLVRVTDSAGAVAGTCRGVKLR